MVRALLRWLCVAPVALLISCDGRSPPSQGSPAPAYHRWVAPSGFAVTDQEGSWACVAKNDRGEPTNIVAGLAKASGDERYPKLPRALFRDPLDVPVDPWATISVPARSSDPLLVVTAAGFAESSPPRPLDELADALWNLEAKRGSVRQVIATNK